MKLLDHLTTFDQVYWDYYQRHHDDRKLINPFTPEGNHVQFMKEYFEVSGKRMLIENFPISIEKLRRPSHVTSTFFLGLLIIHKCKIIMGLSSKNLPGYDALPFVWFLATLFHDVAESLEDDINFVNKIQSIQELYKHYGIEHELLTRRVDLVPPLIFGAIENYFRLRHEEQKIDHGIHAGLYMFDALVKNRIQRKLDDLNNQLFWHESLDDQYALASASVAIHNIWVRQTNLNYAKFDLDNLAKFNAYSSSMYPLPYVFGLVDTIDPLKFFGYTQGINELDVLNFISLDFRERQIIIENLNLPQETFVAYHKMLRKNLRNWLAHTISRRKQIISLKLL